MPALPKLYKNCTHGGYKHLETNNIYFAKYHGFGQKHSTDPTFSELVGILVEIFDKKHKTFIVFIDLRKAFDSVEHNILLSNLEVYGIKGQLFMWFSSYLQYGKQFLTID